MRPQITNYPAAMSVPKTFWLFVATGIGMVLGAYPLYMSGEHTAGLGLLGFGLFWCFLLWLNTRPGLTRYGISKEGIHLKKWWLKKTIPWAEMEGVGFASEQQGEAILKAMEDEFAKDMLQKNLTKLWAERKRYTSINTYLSIVAVYTETNIPFKPIKRKADITGAVVLIKTKGNTAYLISPVDGQAFVTHCLKLMQKQAPASGSFDGNRKDT